MQIIWSHISADCGPEPFPLQSVTCSDVEGDALRLHVSHVVNARITVAAPRGPHYQRARALHQRSRNAVSPDTVPRPAHTMEHTAALNRIVACALRTVACRCLYSCQNACDRGMDRDMRVQIFSGL